MSKTLKEIAEQLGKPEVIRSTGTRRSPKVGETKPTPKVQLIYAFNGTGKTRLSREFKELIAPKQRDSEASHAELPRNKILYYNAFTEDLFYWDNDLLGDSEPKLRIQSNTFTDWILRDRGQDQNIISNFQRYSDEKLTPLFIEHEKIDNSGGRRVAVKTFPEVKFSFDRGSERSGSIKISKGEESIFIWSVFFTLLQEVIQILDEPDPSKRDDNQYDQLEFVFIDDPVSSLDDNHLIELAVNLSTLIKSSKSALKFIITTHSPLFYNILYNEFNNKHYTNLSDGSQVLNYNPDKHFKKYRLQKNPDGLFEIKEQSTDSPFSYHLFLLSEIRKAISNNQVKKFHFNFLRNILEKSATFLGYNKWRDILPKTVHGELDPFANRIVNLSSHSAHAGDEIADVEEKDKEKLIELVQFLESKYGFCKQGQPHA